MILALLLALAQCPPAGELRLDWTCPTATISQCPGQPVNGVQFVVLYDPAALQFDGGEYADTTYPVWTPPIVMWEPGVLSGTDLGPENTDEAVVATLHFTVLSEPSFIAFYPFPQTGFYIEGGEIIEANEVGAIATCLPAPCADMPADVPMFVAGLLAGEYDGRDIQAFVACVLG